MEKKMELTLGYIRHQKLFHDIHSKKKSGNVKALPYATFL